MAKRIDVEKLQPVVGTLTRRRLTSLAGRASASGSATRPG